MIEEILKKKGRPLSEKEIIEIAKRDGYLKDEKNIKKHIRKAVERGEIYRFATHLEGSLKTHNLYYLPEWKSQLIFNPSDKTFEFRINNKTIGTGWVDVVRFEVSKKKNELVF
ncbi:MAG: hypothetical protein QXI09_00185 [Candidatus Aenigmatarchaeota archaeon]